MKKIILSLIIFFLLIVANFVSAHQPKIIYFQSGNIYIENPEISQAFYDEITGSPRNYYISSDKNFNLYLNLLVPNPANRDGKFSANIFLISSDQEQQVGILDGQNYEWTEYYEEFGRDWYMKGPELEQELGAGNYRIEVFLQDPPAQAGNFGKYVLAVGKNESFDARGLLNIFWQLPLLKIQFFNTSPLQFFLTPFGIGGIGFLGVVLIFLAIIYYIIGAIKDAIKHAQAKTLLLTSAGMQMMKEIKSLLQKPAYDITVGFITTASKPLEGDIEFVRRDLTIMREEMGFNVEEIDIEGKTQAQVMDALRLKDIIFVEGGNTFYLLRAMRKCRFEKVIRKLLKEGRVYMGASAGSIVAGKTIKTASWLREEYRNTNNFGVKTLKGLNLVPFDIFVHYFPEDAEIIKKKMRWRWQRRKLKILTDDQAILVQGKEVAIIGKGEQIVL